jgi:hypothetical protein
MEENIITENKGENYEKLKNPQKVNMSAYIRKWFSSPPNSKTYISIALISFLFLFYSIWEIKPVLIDIGDFLGLLSHLTLAYWTGYVLVLVFSIRLFLDKQIKHDSIYLLFLIAIGLFLFGVPIFAEENPRFPWSYYPAGEVRTVLDTNHVDITSNYPLMTYRSWPSMHLTSASILYLTNIKIADLLKYMPLFWVFSVILITFSIGKRLGLSSNQSFASSLLFLASFWTGLYYYGPPSLAYLLYLLLFLFIIGFTRINPNSSLIEPQKDKKIGRIENTILISLTFASLVITHILTPIAIIVGFIFSSSFIRALNKQRVKFIILFLLIFIVWHIYFAPVMFKTGLVEFMRIITEFDFLGFFKTEKYSPGAFLTRWIVHYSRLFYLVAYAIAMIAAAFLYLTRRIKENNMESTKICFFWLIGILVLFALRYGRNEIDDRIFLFSLVPMVFIISFTFDRKIIAVMAILLILFHMPAHYGTESFDSIRTTELGGTKFFATNAVFADRETYFSMWDTFIDYYNPEMIKVLYWTMPVSDKPDPSRIGNATYIINSIGSHNFIYYSFGLDPLEEWIQVNNHTLNFFYDNGYYQIYRNSK